MASIGRITTKLLGLGQMVKSSDQLQTRLANVDARRLEDPKLADQLNDLIRLVKAVADGSYHGLSPWVYLLVLGAIVYLISPYELIDDHWPLVGWLDDLMVVLLVLKLLEPQVNQFIKWEAQR